MNKSNIIDIPLSQISSPKVEMRSQYVQEEMDSLVHSIKLFGLISPIVVKPLGDDYELIAGWRRLKAHEILGKAVIGAVVQDIDDKSVDMIRMHENLMREQINPVDEGAYYRTIMKKHNWQVQDVCIQVKKSGTYVSSRLRIADADQLLQEAVKDGVINISAALELTKIDDEFHRNRLFGYVIKSGASVEQVRRWRIEYESTKEKSVPSESHVLAPDGKLIERDPNVLPSYNESVDPQIEIQEKVIEYRVCFNCAGKIAAEKASVLILCPDCSAVLLQSMGKSAAEKEVK